MLNITQAHSGQHYFDTSVLFHAWIYFSAAHPCLFFNYRNVTNLPAGRSPTSAYDTHEHPHRKSDRSLQSKRGSCTRDHTAVVEQRGSRRVKMMGSESDSGRGGGGWVLAAHYCLHCQRGILLFYFCAHPGRSLRSTPSSYGVDYLCLHPDPGTPARCPSARECMYVYARDLSYTVDARTTITIRCLDDGTYKSPCYLHLFFPYKIARLKAPFQSLSTSTRHAPVKVAYVVACTLPFQ